MSEAMDKLMAALNNKKERPVEEKKSIDEIRDNVVQRAFDMHEKKNYYKWAGEGPEAYDCSGFTQKILKNEGFKNFPRNSAKQGEYTEKPLNKDKSQLKKGDLVFFKRDKQSKTINHVGIYIGVNEKTGKQQFIHSSGQGESCKNNTKRTEKCWGIRINDLDDGKYINRWVGFESLENILIKEESIKKETPKKIPIKKGVDTSENTLSGFFVKEDKKPISTEYKSKNLAEMKAEYLSKVKENQENKETKSEKVKETNIKVNTR